jgi:hypothetical protein
MNSRQEKTQKLFIELINKQLEPHGVTYEDVKGNPNWYMEYNTTIEAEKEFISYCIDKIKKVLKLNNERAEMEAQWFILQWGLTTNQNAPVALKNIKAKGKTSSI